MCLVVDSLLVSSIARHDVTYALFIKLYILNKKISVLIK